MFLNIKHLSYVNVHPKLQQSKMHIHTCNQKKIKKYTLSTRQVSCLKGNCSDMTDDNFCKISSLYLTLVNNPC